ncbi:MAG: AzlC family ABC transporter permease [Truepera sp.]|nr:AzlC family ABC transporter permease [Truepera sp.]
MIPLWVGVVPFGLAYAVSARSAGLSLLETQLMSLVVFAGSAQFSAAGLFLINASSVSLVLTTFIINARHLLYSLALGQRATYSWGRRAISAFFLTDEAFGIVTSQGNYGFTFLLGAELSLYGVWNLSTFLGALVGEVVPDPTVLGADFVFPVAFLALLIPLLRSRLDLAVAAGAGVAALLLAGQIGSGLAILITGVGGALLGAWLSGREDNPSP